MSLTCPDCRGVNKFHNSTTPVEYLAVPQTRQEVVLTSRMNNKRKSAIDEPEWGVPESR